MKYSIGDIVSYTYKDRVRNTSSTGNTLYRRISYGLITDIVSEEDCNGKKEYYVINQVHAEDCDILYRVLTEKL